MQPSTTCSEPLIGHAARHGRDVPARAVNSEGGSGAHGSAHRALRLLHRPARHQLGGRARHGTPGGLGAGPGRRDDGGGGWGWSVVAVAVLHGPLVPGPQAADQVAAVPAAFDQVPGSAGFGAQAGVGGDEQDLSQPAAGQVAAGMAGGEVAGDLLGGGPGDADGLPRPSGAGDGQRLVGAPWSSSRANRSGRTGAQSREGKRTAVSAGVLRKTTVQSP